LTTPNLISALAWVDINSPHRNKLKKGTLRLKVGILFFRTSNIWVKMLDRWKTESALFRR
jgi:hypothetical protein